MRPLVAATVLAVVLAGCTADEAPGTPSSIDLPDAPVPPKPGEGLALLRSATLTAEGYGFEPSIEVDATGAIYVTAAQGAQVERASRLWYSHDNGTTFEEVLPVDPEHGVSNLPMGAEGDLALDAAGQVYFVDLTNLANVPIARSTDRGATWELRNPGAFALGGGDRQWVAGGAKDVVAVTWNQVPTGFWVAVSTDGGRTFPTQTLIPGYGPIGLGPYESTSAGPVEIGPDGTIWVARSTRAGVVAWRSTDGGATFEATTVRATSNETGWLYPVVTTDAAGTAYVAWSEQAGDNVETFYAWSADGAAWSAPVQVTRHAGASVMPWADAGEPGHLAVGYYGAPGVRGDPSDTQAPWFPMVTDVRNATGNATMRVARFSTEPATLGTICTSGLNCNGGRDLGDYFQVAIGPDGTVHAAWCDAENAVYWAVVGLAEGALDRELLDLVLGNATSASGDAEPGAASPALPEEMLFIRRLVGGS